MAIALGLVENVNPELKPRKRTMVDQIKGGIGSPAMAALGSVASAVGGAFVIIGLLTGWITVGNTNAHDMRLLQQQMTDSQQQAALQFEKLNTKLDTKLGPDAMADTVRRLSEISGQLSSLDMRERQDQDSDRSAIVRMQTQLEQILAAQRKP